MVALGSGASRCYMVLFEMWKWMHENRSKQDDGLKSEAAIFEIYVSLSLAEISFSRQPWKLQTIEKCCFYSQNGAAQLQCHFLTKPVLFHGFINHALFPFLLFSNQNSSPHFIGFHSWRLCNITRIFHAQTVRLWMKKPRLLFVLQSTIEIMLKHQHWSLRVWWKHNVTVVTN